MNRKYGGPVTDQLFSPPQSFSEEPELRVESPLRNPMILSRLNMKLVWDSKVGILRDGDSPICIDPTLTVCLEDKDGRAYEAEVLRGANPQLLLADDLHTRLASEGEKFICLTPIPYSTF